MRQTLNMELRPVRYFVAVAESGSLTKVANKLHVSRSILSREIHGFERALGRRLFHRTGRGMNLTEFGLQLLPEAKAFIGEASRFSNAATALTGKLSGTVAIGLAGSITGLLAPHLLSATHRSYPDVSLRLVEGRSAVLEQMLDAGEIDIALSYAAKADIRHGEVPLSLSTLYLVGPPRDPLTAQRSVSLKDVAECPLFLPSRPHAIRTLIEEACVKEGRQLRVACEVDSLLAQKELVMAGLGHTLCLDDAIVQDVRQGRLQATRIRAPELVRVLYMKVAPKNALTAASRAVANLVFEAAQKLVAEGHWRPPPGEAQGRSQSKRTSPTSTVAARMR